MLFSKKSRIFARLLTNLKFKTMKKVLLVLALAAFVYACGAPQRGGAEGVATEIQAAACCKDEAAKEEGKGCERACGREKKCCKKEKE